MATSTWTVAPDNTSANTFWRWSHPISAALASFGWIQTADTGQMVWPVSMISISNAVAAAGVCTFTYTLLQGAALRVGNSITVKSCTTAGLNATYIIQSLPLATTFTVNTATTVTEAETAFGSVDVLIAITNAIGNGGTNTYTYTNTDGVLINGQSIVITGCTTVGFNGTFTVASISGGTFTTTTGISHATEVETGTGIVTAQPVATVRTASTLPPSANVTLYEVWRMNDSLQGTMPVFLKIQIGDNNNSGPAFYISVGAATNGAGTLTGGNVTGANILQAGQTTNSTSTTPTYMSGDTNRLCGVFWPGLATAPGGFFSIERSHDSTGVDTGSYVIVSTMGAGNSTWVYANQSFNTLTQTITEARPPCITKTGALTGAFANTTILCPVFPVIGAVGNPCINMLIGKAADWTDQTQFQLTLYGSQHTYQITNTTLSNAAGRISYDTTATCCIAYRYD